MPSQDEIRKRNERLAVEREDERRRLRKIEEEKERMRVKKEQERRHWDKLAMEKMETKKKEEMERAEATARKTIEDLEAAKRNQQSQ
jgi:hypothetical protein